MANINTGRHVVSPGEDRRKKVLDAGGGVVDVSQLSPEDRAKFIASQEANKPLGECCKAPDKTLDDLKKVLEPCSVDSLPKVTVTPDAQQFIPTRQAGLAGFDVVANVDADGAGRKVISLPPRGSVTVDCGFYINVPDNMSAFISISDELAEAGVIIKNAPAVVRNGDRAKIMVANISKGSVINIDHGQKVAQLRLVETVFFDVEVG